MIGRRTFLASALAAGASAATTSPAAKIQPFGGAALKQAIERLERENGGRIGVAVIDKAIGARFSWRGDERFAMCSTCKYLVAAATLRRIDQRLEQLDRPVSFGKEDVVFHSPFVQRRLGRGTTVGELCDSILTLSDNAATNLLLRPLGGPAGLTRFIRASGDPVTRLDRWETQLNDVKGGDPRDTTTPLAMAANLDRFLLGDVLSPTSRARLLAGLAGNTMGDNRIRAGIPKGWFVGDRTGTSSQGNYNDIGIIRPPGHAPLLVTLYIADLAFGGVRAEAILADATRAIVTALQSQKSF